MQMTAEEYRAMCFGGKNPVRQMQGARSRAKGAAFEERLDATFAAYRRLGTALICKTPEPMRPAKSLGHGRFEAFYTQKAQPDYEGTLQGGQSIVLEAKYTDDRKMLQSRVSKVQAQYMAEKAALGAACYVVAGFGSGNVYCIPWELWADMQSVFGRKYVTEEQLSPYRAASAADGSLMLPGRNKTGG